MKPPVVLVATGYPLHSDGFRSYLSGFYQVERVSHGLPALNEMLLRTGAGVVIADDTFPAGMADLADGVKSVSPTCGLMYVDARPNLFRVVHALEVGFTAYLYPGDALSGTLRLAVDLTWQRERFLSPTIGQLYEHYSHYRALYTALPAGLQAIFTLMGAGLTVDQIAARTGLSRSVIYRRQYRLRQHFGVDSNEEVIGVLGNF